LFNQNYVFLNCKFVMFDYITILLHKKNNYKLGISSY
jgi:hypothetical protein